MSEELPALAAVIDAENFPAKFIGAALSELSKFGSPIFKRAFGDFSIDSLKGWKTAIHEHGLTAEQIYQSVSGKNAADIALTVCASELAQSGKFGVISILSSDSDFAQLAARLREHRILVVGIGEKKTPNAFVKACSQFVYVELLVDKASGDSKLPVDVLELLRTAITNTQNEEGWAHLGQVGSNLRSIDPAFDSRKFGHANLSGLFNNQKGEFEIAQRGATNQKSYYVRAKLAAT
jgi:hypothetical protein